MKESTRMNPERSSRELFLSLNRLDHKSQGKELHGLKHSDLLDHYGQNRPCDGYCSTLCY